MNKEMSVRDMEELRDTYARRARMYNHLVIKVLKGIAPDSPAKWKALRHEAMKKARHFAKVVRKMSA